MSPALKLASVGGGRRCHFLSFEVLTCQPWPARIALGGLELTTLATFVVTPALLMLRLRLTGLDNDE